MDDERRKELGSAPTTPAPEGTNDVPSREPAERAYPPLAAGSGNPDSTLDMPAAEQAKLLDEPGPGAAIGHFIVRRRLGAGGMGVVLAGEDADLGRPVAIKLVRSDAEHPAYRQRLLREAQAMARLEHPNVVRVYEVGTDRGRLYIAMELVEGDTLTRWLHAQRTWREIVAMFLQVGAGLAAVHATGLVHRDFKPDNVLVDREGRARVADFGLARLDLDDQQSPIGQPLTKTGVMMGTPGYMAPEQQLGSGVDARADQYSFCVALREALGGRPLDDARWQQVPASLRSAIGRGLSYDPDERFGSMTELLDIIKRSDGRTAGEPRWMIALLVLAVVGLAAGVVAFVSSRNHSATAPGDAASARVDTPIDAVIARVETPADAMQQPLEIADAPRIVDEVPADAAVVAPSHRSATRDAGVVALPAPPTAPQPQPQPQPQMPAGINIDAPTSKHLPQAKVGDPGHLPIVRAAIRDLGYEGIDLAALDRSPGDMAKSLEADRAAATTSLDKGIATIKLAMVKRRQGNCKDAYDLLRDDGLEAKNPAPEPMWTGRASLVFSLCEIGEGKSDDAYHVIMRAAVWAKSDEVTLAMALIAYELEEKDEAYGRLLAVEKSKNARVQVALHKWLDGLGLGLHGGVAPPPQPAPPPDPPKPQFP